MPFVGNSAWYAILRAIINQCFSARLFSFEFLLSFILFSSEGASKVDLGLTGCLGLNVRVAGRTPEVHIWVGDVGCPGEIHSVNIVVDQTARVCAGIDPVHIAIARRQKSA